MEVVLTKVDHQIHIQASIDKVFDYLIDFTKRIDYVPGLKEVVFIDPLPIEEGSRYVEVAFIAGRSIETTYILTTIKKNECISVKTIKGVFPIEADLYLAELEGKTILSIELAFTLSGPFRLASRLVSGIVRNQAGEILDNIKRIIEL